MCPAVPACTASTSQRMRQACSLAGTYDFNNVGMAVLSTSGGYVLRVQTFDFDLQLRQAGGCRYSIPSGQRMWRGSAGYVTSGEVVVSTARVDFAFRDSAGCAYSTP